MQQKMAEYGFESNDNYDYHVRCLLASQLSGIRCLNIDGENERRNTAFANALAQALEYSHILYYDFTQQDPPASVVIVEDEGETPVTETPSAFERIMIESCAFSEAETTILILDQLQATDFANHLRLYQFISTVSWTIQDTCYTANPKNLLLFLISSQPLYHSLRKSCFKVWVESSSKNSIQYHPEDFNLSDDALPMMESFYLLFTHLGHAPTYSEYAKIFHDAQYHIHTIDELRYSLFGWVEALDQAALFATQLQHPLEMTLQAIEHYIGMDEVEIASTQLQPE